MLCNEVSTPIELISAVLTTARCSAVVWSAPAHVVSVAPRCSPPYQPVPCLENSLWERWEYFMFGMLSWNQKSLWADSCHIFLFVQARECSSAAFTRDLVDIWGCAKDVHGQEYAWGSLLPTPHSLVPRTQQTWIWASSPKTCVCLLDLGLV